MEQLSGTKTVYASEPLSRQLIEDISPLLQRHYEEIAHYQDIPLAPDLGRYQGLHNAGALRIFTARLDGRLIGYGIFIVSANLHYSTSIQSAQDILYIAPEHRGAGLGRKLLAYCDVMLSREGVQMNAHHVKLAHPKLGDILQGLGYERMEVVWVKRLDRPVPFPPPTHLESD